MRGIIWNWKAGDKFYFHGHPDEPHEVLDVTGDFLRWQRDGVRYLAHTSLVRRVAKVYEN